MKRSFSLRQFIFHPAMLSVISGLVGAAIGFLINLVTGGSASQMTWIALTFAILFSLSITAWQVYSQDRADQQMTTMLQEMAFQTYFFALLADKPEISQIAQQRLGQMLKGFSPEQQVHMLRFFSDHGFPATFIGDALQGSTSLIGSDLHQIILPQVNLEGANLSRVNLSKANLSEAHLQGALLRHTDLSGANLSQAHLSGTELRGANLQGANLTGADINGSSMGTEKAEHAQGGSQTRKDPQRGLQVNLANAILAHAHVRGSYLQGADLSGANLQGADLTKTYLQGANLSGANLQGANLTKTYLQDADLTGANLQGADLTETTLIDAILDGADLRDAKVTKEQLMMVRSSVNMQRDIQESE